MDAIAYIDNYRKSASTAGLFTALVKPAWNLYEMAEAFWVVLCFLDAGLAPKKKDGLGSSAGRFLTVVTDDGECSLCVPSMATGLGRISSPRVAADRRMPSRDTSRASSCFMSLDSAVCVSAYGSSSKSASLSIGLGSGEGRASRGEEIAGAAGEVARHQCRAACTHGSSA